MKEKNTAYANINFREVLKTEKYAKVSLDVYSRKYSLS